MVAAALLAASTLLGPLPSPAPAEPVTVTAATSRPDREWAAARPNRGQHARTVALASLPPRGWERFTACVINRESHGQPGVLNGEGSGAAGLVQFMPDWRHGLPYIVAERLRQFGMPGKVARQVRVYLSRVHFIDRYPEVYQRVAFAEVLDDGLWWHWDGHTCNGLVPR